MTNQAEITVGMKNGLIVSEFSIRNGKRSAASFWIVMMMVRRNLSWFIKTTTVGEKKKLLGYGQGYVSQIILITKKTAS